MFIKNLYLTAACLSVLAIAACLFFNVDIACAQVGESGGYLAEYQEPKPDSAASSWGSIFAYVVSLMAVFTFVSAAAYFVSKFLSRRINGFNSVNSVNVLATLPLGSNKSIMMVKMAGSIMVVGVTDSNISLLKEIIDPREIDEVYEMAQENNSAETFTSIFEKQKTSLEKMSKRFPNIFS